MGIQHCERGLCWVALEQVQYTAHTWTQICISHILDWTSIRGQPATGNIADVEVYDWEVGQSLKYPDTTGFDGLIIINCTCGR